MRATMHQFQDLRKSERAHVLGALSPEHRAYLASVAGQLAIAADPDPRAAAASLDAKLSSGEKQAILNANQSYRDQMKALHEQIRAKMQAMRPPSGTPSGMAMAGGPPCGNPGAHPGWAKGPGGRAMHAPDAGRILLDAAGIGHSRGMFMMGGPGGMHHRGMRGCMPPAPSPAG